MKTLSHFGLVTLNSSDPWCQVLEGLAGISDAERSCLSPEDVCERVGAALRSLRHVICDPLPQAEVDTITPRMLGEKLGQSLSKIQAETMQKSFAALIRSGRREVSGQPTIP